MATLQFVTVPVDDDEPAAVFDTTHYKNGINGDFIGSVSSRAPEEVIAEFAGTNGGGGKFEDTEKVGHKLLGNFVFP
jgi:hypothetical protein